MAGARCEGRVSVATIGGDRRSPRSGVAPVYASCACAVELAFDGWLAVRPGGDREGVTSWGEAGVFWLFEGYLL